MRETYTSNRNINYGIVAPNGHIRGCFEEVYEGISVRTVVDELSIVNH